MSWKVYRNSSTNCLFNYAYQNDINIHKASVSAARFIFSYSLRDISQVLFSAGFAKFAVTPGWNINLLSEYAMILSAIPLSNVQWVSTATCISYHSYASYGIWIHSFHRFLAHLMICFLCILLHLNIQQKLRMKRVLIYYMEIDLK